MEQLVQIQYIVEQISEVYLKCTYKVKDGFFLRLQILDFKHSYQCYKILNCTKS